MAERRMFAKTIIDSDAFLDMPLSTQALYFHLSMRADDDGFINNPKKIQRMIGCSDDDLKLLIAKNFIIPFESGIVVIKHWRIHNYIQKDRYKPTVYVEEMSQIRQKPNSAYTLDTECIQDGYSLETQDRIGKDSIGKTYISSNEDISPSELSDDEPKHVLQDVVDKWNELSAYGITKVRFISAESPRHKYVRARIKQYGRDSFDEVVENIKNSDFLQGKSNSKRPFLVDFDWVIKPSNYPKVLEGKYNNRDDGNGFKPRYEMPTGLEKPKIVRQ